MPHESAAWSVIRVADLPGVEALHGGSVLGGPVLRMLLDAYGVSSNPLGADVRTYRGRVYDGRAGVVDVAEPGEVIACRARDGAYRHEALFVAPAVLEQAASEMGIARNPHFRSGGTADPFTFGLFQRLHRAIRGRWAQLDVEERFADAIAGLLGRHLESGRSAPRVRPVPHAARRARTVLVDRWNERVSLDELAREAGLSKFHLVRVFKSAFGASPADFQRLVRIAQARARLRAGEPIASVATVCGFADQAHLTRMFRRAWPTTPGRYQRARSG